MPRRVWEDGWAGVPEAAEPEVEEEPLLRTVEPEEDPAVPRDEEPEVEEEPLLRTVEPEEDPAVPRDEEPVELLRFWLPELPDPVFVLRRTWEDGWVGVAEEALLRTDEEELLRTAEPEAEVLRVEEELPPERVTCLALVLCRESFVLRVCEAEERVCASTPDGVARSIARMAADSAEVTVFFMSKKI